MTVRERARISRNLGSRNDIRAIEATSNITGELQVQVIDENGIAKHVFIPSSVGGKVRPINLLAYATKDQWRDSRSFLDAIRLGHLTVTIK